MSDQKHARATIMIVIVAVAVLLLASLGRLLHVLG